MGLIHTAAASVGGRISRPRRVRRLEVRIAELEERLAGSASHVARAETDLEVSHKRPSSAGERLPEADGSRDEFLAGVCHELRTPLTPIGGYIELLLEEDAGPLTDEQREFLGVMQRSAHRLGRLLDDLILLTRIDSGRFSLQVEPVDLVQTAIDAVDAAGEDARRDGIRLELHTAAVDGMRGDRARLVQALRNLVGNAMAVTSPGGGVAVRVFREDRHVAVEVAVTGIAISSSDAARMFERFARAGGPSARGSGFGLSIAKAVAEAHGGELSFLPDQEGGTFRLELPIEAAKAGMRG